MLNPNASGIDPSGRGFGQFAPAQGQASTNIYGLGGGSIPVLQSVQQGMQGGMVGGRQGYGLPASSGFQQIQQDRFGGAGLGPGALQHYGQAPNRGIGAHPLTLGPFSSNPAVGRNAICGQIGLPNQGMANAGVRPMLDRPNVMNPNMSFPAFGGNVGNPVQVAGLSNLQWPGVAGVQAGTGLNIGAMGRSGARNLGNLSALGGGIQRDMGGQRGMTPGPGGGGMAGLLHGGVGQQNNTPIPSQDLLAIMSRSNARAPGTQSGIFNLGQIPGGGQVGASGAPGGGMLGGGGPMSFLGPQQQQQRAATLGTMNFSGLDQAQRMQGEPPKFDVNDFPSLGGAAVPKPPPVGQQSMRPQMQMIDGQAGALFDQQKAGQGELGGFSIQKEDFPALPRAVESGPAAPGDNRVIGQQGQTQPPNGLPSGRANLRSSQPMSSVVDQLRTGEMSRNRGPPGAPGTVNPYFQASHNMPASVHDSLRTIQQGQMPLRVGARNLRPGWPSSNMTGTPMGSTQGSNDRFSLLGLLSVIRMIDEDLAMLALGQDLTTLGLKLDQAGSDLHKTFLSPWSDHQLPGTLPNFKVPGCYMIPPEKLQPDYLTKFKDETLFYLFYSMPGEEAQHLAGYELTRRGLVWHKDHKVWMMRLPNAQLQKSPEGWERGSYIFFDTDEWKYSRKDNFLLKYEAIEAAPTLPSRTPQARAAVPAQQNPSMAAPTGAPGGGHIMVPAK